MNNDKLCSPHACPPAQACPPARLPAGPPVRPSARPPSPCSPPSPRLVAGLAWRTRLNVHVVLPCGRRLRPRVACRCRRRVPRPVEVVVAGIPRLDHHTLAARLEVAMVRERQHHCGDRRRAGLLVAGTRTRTSTPACTQPQPHRSERTCTRIFPYSLYIPGSPTRQLPDWLCLCSPTRQLSCPSAPRLAVSRSSTRQLSYPSALLPVSSPTRQLADVCRLPDLVGLPPHSPRHREHDAADDGVEEDTEREQAEHDTEDPRPMTTDEHRRHRPLLRRRHDDS